MEVLRKSGPVRRHQSMVQVRWPLSRLHQVQPAKTRWLEHRPPADQNLPRRHSGVGLARPRARQISLHRHPRMIWPGFLLPQVDRLAAARVVWEFPAGSPGYSSCQALGLGLGRYVENGQERFSWPAVACFLPCRGPVGIAWTPVSPKGEWRRRGRKRPETRLRRSCRRSCLAVLFVSQLHCACVQNVPRWTTTAR